MEAFDPLVLARIQFAANITFHILFPTVTIALCWALLFFRWRWLATRDTAWLEAYRLWTKVFALSFALGVVSGITMSFQFGTNWPGFMERIGNIAGPLLGYEVLTAFFLEATFLGVMLFGHGKVSERVHLFATAMVALGTTSSAFWILAANSWMQTPAGYEITSAGKIVLTDFGAAVFNPSTVARFLHTVLATWITGAVLVCGIAGYYVRKGLHGETARMMLKIGIILFAVTPLLQLGAAHGHAIQVIDFQPMKAAAMEGHFTTARGADVYVAGYVDEKNEKTYGISIPKGLSFLYNFDFNSEIKGLREVPKEDWPPVNLVFQAYHIMVTLGMIFIGLGLLGALLLWTGKLYTAKWYLWLLPFLIPLPHLAHETGWITAEAGRQPWIIQGLMRTARASSVVVSKGELAASLTMFALVYLLLLVMFVMLFIRIVKQGPEAS